MRCALALMLALACCVPAMAQDIDSVDSFYEGAETDDWAEYKMTVKNGDAKPVNFKARFTIAQAGFATFTVRTERWYEKTMGSKPRTIETSFKKEGNFRAQLEANYFKYGYRNIRDFKGAVDPNAVEVTVGGKKLTCQKITVTFSARLGEDKIPMMATEVYHYCKDVPAMRMAKMEGTYVLKKPGGKITQKIMLELTKHK